MGDAVARASTVHHLPEEVLAEVFSYLPLQDLLRIVRQVCRRWREVVDDWVEKRFVYKPQESTSEKEVVRLLQSAPKLRRVVLRHFATPRVMEALLQNCKDLREIELRGNDIMMLRRFVRCCPNMEHLILGDYQSYSMNMLAALGECKSLVALTLKMYEVPEGLLPMVAKSCPLLKRLNLSLSACRYEDLSSLLETGGSQLESLSLMCCEKETVCLFPLIAQHCRMLNELSLLGHYGGTEKLSEFFRSPLAVTLKKLSLSDVRNMNGQLMEAVFRNCPSLVSFAVATFPDVDGLLAGVDQLAHLQFLDLSECWGLTDRGVAHIVLCKQLRSLSLNNCAKMTDECFRMCCSNLSQLHTLRMNCTYVSSESLSQVPVLLMQLRYLSVAGRDLLKSIDALKHRMPALQVDYVNDALYYPL